MASLIRQHCLDCHDRDAAKGGLNLQELAASPLAAHADRWETVVRRLEARQMPPAKRKERPSETEFATAVSALVATLDAAAQANPRPGRTESFRRLNRAEYQNAIRDLLAVDIDAATWLPADSASHGFDNVTVGTLPPLLLDRYITAAQKISRLALGHASRSPGGETFRVRPDLTQEDRVEGLPFGTRGGTVIRHTFPQSGDYEIQVRLARDRNDDVEGLREPHDVVILLNGAPVHEFTVRPPAPGAGHHFVDAYLKVRLAVPAGPAELGVTFRRNASSLLETRRQPYLAHFNFHRHPRIGPAIYQVSVTGPFRATGPGDSPSRRHLGLAATPPASREEEVAAARQVLSRVLRRAWRRPVSDADLERILPLFENGRLDGGFEAGLEAALSAILVSREFLFRVESDPPGAAPGSVRPVTDLELATRLSFFLWSSLPDDRLLELAERRELGRPAMLEAEVRRLLADPRARSLVDNFASQWLHLRNLDGVSPDGRLYPDFDDNLRQALRRETELLVASVFGRDRSVLDLLRPGTDPLQLNERLARHYGIPHVYGVHFRPVPPAPGGDAGSAGTATAARARGGLLRQGSVLTVTSYANRTSPVLRGKWILENLLGTPPPPPLPDVPALDDVKVSASLPVRARLAAHRDKPACAGCHEFIDPPGFALEHYDAIGRWRDLEEGQPVDASGGLPDGSTFSGVEGLEAGLVARPSVFVTTLASKLLTFALGRGAEPADAPALRAVVRAARAEDYHFSALVRALVQSPPFRYRASPAAPADAVPAAKPANAPPDRAASDSPTSPASAPESAAARRTP